MAYRNESFNGGGVKIENGIRRQWRQRNNMA
jgi:hypothetical protein